METIRGEVQELVELGTLPDENSLPAIIKRHEDILLKVSPPVSSDEAVMLASIFGPDECFGLSWHLIHLIETAPDWPMQSALQNTSNPSIKLMLTRIENAQRLCEKNQRIFQDDATYHSAKGHIPLERPSAIADLVEPIPKPFEWVAIPDGTVKIEAYSRTFDIRAFYISRYPITYAQFQLFIETTDGYSNSDWWAGLDIEANHWKTPEPQRWRFANNPRDSVSWYEAVAFCRWLSSVTGDKIALPTEWEWSFAAQGLDKRSYPWGDQFDPERCNTIESGLDHTVPVDTYNTGASPFGVMDMIGNVFEWCLNTNLKPNDPILSCRRAIRGGAWNWNERATLCEYSFSRFPFERINNLGFRIVKHI